MFTGIIEATGTVKAIHSSRYTFSHTFDEPLDIGESVSVSGMCVTVVEADASTFGVDIMQESRDRTSFGVVKVEDEINLERAAPTDGRNSGHFVLGHVDECAEILNITPETGSTRVRFSITQPCLVVEKGSITLEGISLTISSTEKNWAEVAVIPHTWEHTNLKNKKVGGSLNLEYDILGKYVLKSLAKD